MSSAKLWPSCLSLNVLIFLQTSQYWMMLVHQQAQCWQQKLNILSSLQWCHNGGNGISDHQPHHCLLNRLFRRRSKKTSKLCVTGLCAGYSPVTGEFPAQMASNAENVSIWWCHHVQSSSGINDFEHRVDQEILLKEKFIFQLKFYKCLFLRINFTRTMLGHIDH